MRKKFLFVSSVVVAFVLVLLSDAWAHRPNSRSSSPDAERGSLQPQVHHSAQESVIFFDDFESGSVGWTTHDLTDMDVMWHPDTFRAYSGNSWWCGQPEIGGYYDVWYQMMVTPEIDLSAAVAPVTLSFHQSYLTEGGSEVGGYKYWDGGNIRISTDGGNTFAVMYPSVGEYSTTCMWAWSFFEPNVNPDSSDSMPGYSGSSNGWIDAQFDLSDFVGHHVKISFVFASDDYLSTVYLMGGYPELRGWFIDNVTIEDSQDTLFFDDAGDTRPLQMSFWVRPPSGDWWRETTDQSFSPTHSWMCDGHPLINNVLESPWIELPQHDVPYVSFYYLPAFTCEGWWNVWITTDSVHWDVFMERTNESNEEWDQYLGSLFSFAGKAVKFRWEMFGGGIECPSSIIIDDVNVYTVWSGLIVENTNDSGYGSLRNAISSANTGIGSNTIVFNIPETDPGYDPVRGVWTIRPQSPLPVLVDTSTIIDGTTQAENQGNRNPYGPEIEIDGSDIDEGMTSYGGITVFSEKNVIKGFIINRFPMWGILIGYERAIGNQITGNYVGTDETGEDSFGNAMGIGITDGANGNIIGGPNIEGRNVISGNSGGSGVVISGTGTDDNSIIGNYIGVGASGATSLGNKLRGVIITDGAKGNVIGGNIPEKRNVISGNYRAGVYIADSDSNVVLCNSIGTDATGTIGLGNGHGPLWVDGGGRLFYNAGIVIDNGSGNVIGDSTSGGRNLISGNDYNGVYVTKSGSRYNRISGNLIGTDIAGDTNLGNELAGVKIDSSARDNTITHGNVISFNGTDGVYIEGPSSRGSAVDGNTVTDNRRDGIRIENVNDGSTELTNNTVRRNLVGIHVIDGVGVPTIEGNVIEDNIEAGILIEDGGGVLKKGVPLEDETIENNVITLNTIGIHVRPLFYSKQSSYQSTLSVFHNNIFSNADYGLLNEDPAVTVVADGNWWGDASGPYDEESNPGGHGDAVTGNVVCSNWLSDILVLSICSVADVGGIAGSDVVVGFQVYNVSSTGHIFDMTVTDSLGWPLTPEAFSLTLGVMAATRISIAVSIPEGVEDGTENTIRLSGISRDDPDVCGWHEAIVRVMKGERGDVNADGLVNILDVIRAVNIILRIGEPPSEFENWAADCNADETVNILDVIGIVNGILGTGVCQP